MTDSAQNHPIFEAFERVTTTGTGAHLLDFVGGRTRVEFKAGWEKFAHPEGREIKVNYPPLNEHYFDWIATLTTVAEAEGTFRMAELGAGWAPWLVRAALAARQRPEITGLELLAVEADPTHFGWVSTHFEDNGLAPTDHLLVEGAVSAEPGMFRFPVIEAPNVDYGVSLRQAVGDVPTIEVRGYILPELLAKFSGPLDFLHMDIQGAEYDAIPSSLSLLSQTVKTVMIGTHQSDDMHDGLARDLLEAGWVEVMSFPRNTTCATPYGDVQFGDGVLYFRNPRL